MIVPYEKEYRSQLPPDVLIADDNPVLLRLFTHLLEQDGFKVRTVRDGNQCLQMILQKCPDVLIIDSGISGIDGLEICRQIRDFHSRKILPHYTYILVSSEQKERKLLLECLDAGADDFIEYSSAGLSDLKIEVKSRLKAALRTRKLEQSLEFAAKYDSLTTLLNRITFYELAQGIWERSIRNVFPLSAIMFDCDFFKRVNDIFGHSAGDAVLQGMANILKGVSRTSDLVCRYGGEEFCVLLAGCNEKTAWNWAERIRKQFEISPIKYGNFTINFTVSFGISQRSEDTLTLDHLIERSDQALIFAKQAGRNRCIRYSDTVACNLNISTPNGLLNMLFDNVSANDIMIPFSIFLNETEKVSSVADYFLKMSFESLPVINEDGELLGMISGKNLISVVGNAEQWNGSINGLIEPNIVSYPYDIPVRHIYNFFCRVSTNQVLLLQGKKPVGFINRSTLLRWLRNQWADVCKDKEIISPASAGNFGQEHLNEILALLNKEVEKICNVLGEKNTDTEENSNNEYRQIQLITSVSQIQDIMDIIFRNCAAQNATTGNGGNLAQLGFG